MRLSRSLLWLAIVALSLPASLSCGGGAQNRIDESGDLDAVRRRASHPVPTGLDGSRWRWIEAYCTEGPLDLLSRGFAQTLRVTQNEDEFILTYDQVFATEACAHTVVQRAQIPTESHPEWLMQELSRVPVPATRECFGNPEADRPGEVRMIGDRLEVLVQRSNWCRGFEVRMVYEATAPELLTHEEIIRRYVAYFGLGDAAGISELFADGGSLLEPFTITATGDPYRHDGRADVRAWLTETFNTAGWRAMRIRGIEQGADETTWIFGWEYMDDRLEQPFTGRNRFTIAGGEIFEAEITLTSQPPGYEPPGAPAQGDAAQGGAATPASGAR